MYRLLSRHHHRHHGRMLPLISRGYILPSQTTSILHSNPQLKLQVRRNGTVAASPNGGTTGGGGGGEGSGGSGGATPEDDLPWYHPRWRRALTSLIIGIKLLAFTHLVVSKVFIISQCEGPSMLPTLPTSGSVIVNNLHSRGRCIKVGDLIAAHRPDDMDVMLLKRVIGMPGDYVVTDPMAAGSGEETMMVKVPEGHCWIAGDNLSHSIDSRFYGPVPLALVMGKVVAQVAGGRRWFSGPFTEVSKDE
ncbi:hypothetical protein AOL_s00054g419 [Orbilia oligospora ATCC 24927]|uniref:Peptidase S26 domain-containing protein n=1 Tax=Arthrobotrys oligospora (strain ATCC 24927 / CBS 115.81 / DSM 1491) TaxID=756982 RepID=G1X6C5_ARTOA|nr:hypothetical protein AOL_s00054g419 [Orbilia oligospora ATCC 24927]EGX51349.1 hypothetical protein AOL_s00054g419 [Orbilia oligospora ATCC 24927]